ncbi:hypothetical protein E9993_12870 [Labilibacter sediminis]|nr:hypothetical protein E9993_12870 [Labilibacter sediminis]
MKGLYQIAVILIVALSITSCNSDYSGLDTDKSLKGVFIMNQGGTVCYYNDGKDTLALDIYKDVNGSSLGDELIAFSMRKDTGYILTEANGQQVIEVIDPKDFKSTGSIAGYTNLTDVTAVSDRFIYASQGTETDANSGEVIVLDATTHSSVATIDVGKYPTRMLYAQGKKVYVANSGSQDNQDSTIMVIDITKQVVTDTVYLEQEVDELIGGKLKTPVEMVIDINNDIWVLCKGVQNESGKVVNAGLAKVSYGSHAVTVFPFDGKEVEDGYIGNGRNCLARSSSGVYIFYINNGTYQMSIGASELPSTDEKFFEGDYTDIVFDAIKINPKTGEYYCALDIDGGSANDKVYIFDRYGLNKDDEYIVVGEMPRDFVFYP